jgi:hypothetical protein
MNLPGIAWLGMYVDGMNHFSVKFYGELEILIILFYLLLWRSKEDPFRGENTSSANALLSKEC